MREATAATQGRNLEPATKLRAQSDATCWLAHIPGLFLYLPGPLARRGYRPRRLNPPTSTTNQESTPQASGQAAVTGIFSIHTHLSLSAVPSPQPSGSPRREHIQGPESNLAKQNSHLPQKQGPRSGAQFRAAAAAAPESVCKVQSRCHFVRAS